MDDPNASRRAATPRVVQPDDPDWPRGLRDLANPPLDLRVLGTLPPLDRAVAIVGTRYADDEALDFTRSLAGDLARAGCAVVSGGALGVDAAAHRGAIDAGGTTVAVLASGFDPAYPPQHRALFGRIAASGALLSEVPDGTPPHRGRFLARNRLVAALARVVVVVQAPSASGALSTAAHARAMDRPLLAVPSAPWDVRGQGCLALLAGGAGICVRARDVLSVAALGSGPAGPGRSEDLREASGEAQKHSGNRDLDQDGRTVLGHLGTRPRSADEVSRATGLSVARVQRALLELLLLGEVEERGFGRWVRHPPSPIRPSAP